MGGLISKKRLEDIFNFFNENGRDETLDKFKISSSTLERYRRLYINEPKKEKESYEIIENKNKKEIIVKSYQIKTLQELIEYYNINMDIWECERFRVNNWGNEGYNCSQTRATFIPKKQKIDLKKQADLFIECLEKYKPPIYTIKKPIMNKSGNMLEMAIPDIHLGQLSWNRETGDLNWDLKITRDTFLECTNKLLDCVNNYSIERIMFTVGNDFFNVNGEANTTVNGTPQDEDARWQKTFAYGWKMIIKAIDLCRQVAPVDVIIVPGNHDRNLIYYLGTVLEMWAKDKKDVTIDNDPLTRKYYRWGLNLIGLDHGKDVAINSYPGLMSTEYSKYSETKYREMHLGHWHKERKLLVDIDEFPGVKIRHLPSLVPRSAWEGRKGFTHTKESKALLWNKEKGLICEFNFHI